MVMHASSVTNLKEGQLKLVTYISKIEAKYHELFSKLPRSLQCLYKSRCKAAHRDGGGKGTYEFPPFISDEVEFRRQCS